MGLRNPIVGFCYPTLTLAWQHSAWNPFGFYAGSLLPLLLTCSSDHGFVFVFFLSCFQCTQGKSCSGCLLRWAAPHCYTQLRSPCPGSFLFCSKGIHNATEAYCACADAGGECLQHVWLWEQCQCLHFWEMNYILKWFCSSLLLLFSILHCFMRVLSRITDLSSFLHISCSR